MQQKKKNHQIGLRLSPNSQIGPWLY